MQSTWENLVDYDMSESGVRPLTLRELSRWASISIFLDQPLGYSQSNGTSSCASASRRSIPGATIDHIEVTNGTSEANYLLALSAARARATSVAMQVPNYMQLPGRRRAASAPTCRRSSCARTRWEPDWDEFERAVTPKTRLLYLSNPEQSDRLGVVGRRDAADRRALRADRDVAAGRRGLSRRRDRSAAHASFWGMGDRVIVTSGLSKAYGIPGVRIGWIVGPQEWSRECWSQHDYITIGPNKMSDRIARMAVEPHESRAVLRPHRRDPPPQPADRARVDRRLRRPADVERAAGGRHRAGEVRRRHRRASTSPNASARQPEHADRPGHPRRPGRPPAHLAGRPRGSSCGKACGGLAPS